MKMENNKSVYVEALQICSDYKVKVESSGDTFAGYWMVPDKNLHLMPENCQSGAICYSDISAVYLLKKEGVLNIGKLSPEGRFPLEIDYDKLKNTFTPPISEFRKNIIEIRHDSPKGKYFPPGLLHVFFHDNLVDEFINKHTENNISTNKGDLISKKDGLTELQRDALDLCTKISEIIDRSDKFAIVNLRFQTNEIGGFRSGLTPSNVGNIISFRIKNTIDYLTIKLHIIDGFEEDKLFLGFYGKVEGEYLKPTGIEYALLAKYNFNETNFIPKFYNKTSLKGEGFLSAIFDISRLLKFLEVNDNPFIAVSSIEKEMNNEMKKPKEIMIDEKSTNGYFKGDISYEVTYSEHTREIKLNNTTISKLNFDSTNSNFFEYIFKHPNELIKIAKIEEETAKDIQKSIHQIIRTLGFKKELKKIFFPIATKDEVKFVNPITSSYIVENKLPILDTTESKRLTTSDK
jgi:hypothetical protein